MFLKSRRFIDCPFEAATPNARDADFQVTGGSFHTETIDQNTITDFVQI